MQGVEVRWHEAGLREGGVEFIEVSQSKEMTDFLVSSFLLHIYTKTYT